MTRHTINTRKARAGQPAAGRYSAGPHAHHAQHPDRKRLADIGRALIAMHTNPNTQAGLPTPGEAIAMLTHAREIETLAAKHGPR